jgi:hypothetical protein
MRTGLKIISLMKTSKRVLVFAFSYLIPYLILSCAGGYYPRYGMVKYVNGKAVFEAKDAGGYEWYPGFLLDGQAGVNSEKGKAMKKLKQVVYIIYYPLILAERSTWRPRLEDLEGRTD